MALASLARFRIFLTGLDAFLLHHTPRYVNYSEGLKLGLLEMGKRQNWDTLSVQFSDSDHATSPMFVNSLDGFT